MIEKQLTLRGTLMGNSSHMYKVMNYIRSGTIKPMMQEIELAGVADSMKAIKQLRSVGKAVVRVGGMAAH